MFEYASRIKVRFHSSKGELTVEQLWEVPLRSNSDFNLNEVAKLAKHTVDSYNEESFVDEIKENPAKERAELALTIVKHVINTKLREEEDQKEASAKRVEKQKLLAILAEKQEDKLSELSINELNKKIAALD